VCVFFEVNDRQWLPTGNLNPLLFGREGGYVRLLVIEDEPRIAEILKVALERAEFVVDTVRLRSDAREALANRPTMLPSLILGYQTVTG
jgi:hypothetical protein